MAVRGVIECCGAVLNRMAPERDEPPGSALPIRPYGVIGLADIRPVARRHEALQVEGHFLAPDPQLELATGELCRIGGEGLLEIDPIFIGWREKGLAEGAGIL